VTVVEHHAVDPDLAQAAPPQDVVGVDDEDVPPLVPNPERSTREHRRERSEHLRRVRHASELVGEGVGPVLNRIALEDLAMVDRDHARRGTGAFEHRALEARYLALDAPVHDGRARDEDERLVFEIESWARSGDRLSNVMHDRLRMAKEVQLHMWTSVLERVARRVGGRLDGGVDVETRRAEPPG
jgi:hypothetical protein